MKQMYLEDLRTSRYEANIERLGEHSDTCIACGQRTAEKGFLQLTTSGFLVDETEKEVEDSQGLFPVGSECLKRFHKLAKAVE